MREKLKQFFTSPQNKKASAAAVGLVIIAVFGYIIGAKPFQNTGAPKGVTTPDSDAALELRPGDDSATAAERAVQTPSQNPTLLPRGSQNPPLSGTPPSRPDARDGMSFEEAMRLFGLFGYRYQFVNCSGMPGNFVMKQNTRFMLDNRDAIAHNIVVATQSFFIPGYDFVVAYAKDLGKYMITCDGGGAAAMEVVL